MVHGLKAVHIYYLEYILIFLSQPLLYCQVLCLEMDITYWLPKDYLGDQHHEITVLPRTVFLLLMPLWQCLLLHSGTQCLCKWQFRQPWDQCPWPQATVISLYTPIIHSLGLWCSFPYIKYPLSDQNVSSFTLTP